MSNGPRHNEGIGLSWLGWVVFARLKEGSIEAA